MEVSVSPEREPHTHALLPEGVRGLAACVRGPGQEGHEDPKHLVPQRKITPPNNPSAMPEHIPPSHFSPAPHTGALGGGNRTAKGSARKVVPAWGASSVVKAPTGQKTASFHLLL